MIRWRSSPSATSRMEKSTRKLLILKLGRLVTDAGRDESYDPWSESGDGLISCERICPGRHFSTQALMTMVTSVLACFDIKPPKDEKGQEIPMGPMDVASLVVSYVPLPGFD